MRTAITRVLGMLFLGLLAFIGVTNASGGNSTKLQSSIISSNQEIQIGSTTESELVRISNLEVKKSNAKIIVKE